MTSSIALLGKKLSRRLPAATFSLAVDKRCEDKSTMELTGKRIFVSGASGRLGVGLIRELLNVGAEVFAGVRTQGGADHL
jgi:glutamate dehydrogenase/leucine dehydrogenase